ncbi:Spy/CpxP family protein refolding chaperone [Methylobacterium sp. WSM2598]|uniref:Spy/CpxP family protein refolding chaperone n=1 Tax=Methylobacterium sp. WSM2598 TaxID=398261 RepID=UPI000379833B|nr:Spy/CpxP family protein refolding chaperone [Methylobacterium sp. WSM2598]
MSNGAMNGPAAQAPAPRRRILRRTALALGLLLAGGTAGLAVAMGGAPDGFGFRDPGQRLARLQFMARRALDSVGATSDQENRIHDIIASASAALMKEGPTHEEMRRRLADLLKAPTVDRAAIEALRAEMVRSLDARSKIIAGALVDAAGQVSAEQRAKLVDRVASAMEQHRGFGRWRHPWGGEGGRPERGPGWPQFGGAGPQPGGAGPQPGGAGPERN